MENIDINFDFHADSHGKDPDVYSSTTKFFGTNHCPMVKYSTYETIK
jgi:hypothetical protein